ncbi:hypothetical protein EEL31_10330 [Brevibacillus laterosporus]|nr:hypothetical protein [Brevibacillus laterosporus]TPG68723.1 hypothetical protein EEL31_09415 [Brevibacillus laterosporus]TPG68885.1 hypothetical protein EEL31_10330 [Brevibacillus laterosporus]
MPKVIVGSEKREFDVVIYVDVLGDDETGDGSRKKPFRHIDKAYSALPNTGKACIYALSEGAYELKNGIQGGLKSTIELTYGVHPLHLGKVIFNLYKISHNDRIRMGFLNEFIGIVFKAMSSLLNQYYERFDSYTTLNLRFSNCVFDDQSYGTSFPIVIMNPNQNTIINCFEFVNCIFKQKASWGDDPTVYKFINCAFANTTMTPQPYNLLGATFNTHNQIATGEWEHKGTGENLDGSPAHIGVYGGEYAWEFDANAQISFENDIFTIPRDTEYPINFKINPPSSNLPAIGSTKMASMIVGNEKIYSVALDKTDWKTIFSLEVT